MSGNFELSDQQKQTLIERQKRRLVLRNEFLKQTTNPFRHATGEGGTVFDPALQRLQALNVSHYEHFKPTFASFRFVMGFVILPIIGYAWWMKSDRDKLEEKYRSGQVAYKDRRFKFI